MYIDGQNNSNFNLSFTLEPQVRAREEESCRFTLLLTQIVKMTSTKFPMTDTLTFKELIIHDITHILIDKHRLL